MRKIIFLIFCVFPLITCAEPQSEDWTVKEYQSVFDYEYQKNTYFYVGHDYRDHFEPGLSNDLLHFTLDAWTQIMELQVWISTSTSDSEGVKGIAVIDPEFYSEGDMADTDNAAIYKGYFKPLSSEAYEFDGDRGYFWLTEPADDAAVIAISYILKDKKQIGTMIQENKRPENVLLKLIKPKNQNASEAYQATWPLMMKNVYYLGKNIEEIKNLNIMISDTSNPSSQVNSNKRAVLNMFGLDMIDECRYYMRNGDGIVDFNSFNINLKTGILVFPGLYPFNPLPESRFQIEDACKADIYNSTSTETLKSQSKFKITIIDILKSDSETAFRTDNKSIGG